MAVTGGAVAAAVAGAVVSNAMAPGVPDAPALLKNPVMPLPDDSSVQDAKRRSLAGQVARRGRASTILSDPNSDTLG